MNSTITFKNLTDDLCFKFVFSHEAILKDFINTFFKYLGLDEYFVFSDITPEAYIEPDNKETFEYYGDIISILDNETIMDLEMYSNKFSKKHYNKSYGYMCRLFDRNINNTKTYDGKKIISLNLINGNFRSCNPKLINEHRFKNNNNLNSDNGNTIMYLVRLDKLKSLEYNLNENRFITWLRLINAKSITEMEKLGRNDKIMNETIEFVKHWNKAYKRESFDDFIKLKQAEAYDEANEKAAKNLLSLNISISDISKATGLSKSKLLKLQKGLTKLKN